jgi:ribosome-associated heat shock protein Hsp15
VTAPREGAPPADALRIDRWLWCARFYKTRTLAAQAVRGGDVRLNGRRVKPAHDVRIGDSVAIDRDDEVCAITVAALPDRRGPSQEAQRCYIETPESVERRTLEGQRRAAAALARPPTDSRPDKRTRRLLLRVRGRS